MVALIRIARHLPLACALAALFVFLLSLAPGLTLFNLTLVAKLDDATSSPLANQPALWLVTLPLRLVATNWIAPGVNLLSALSAAIVLGLLVRSVKLLLPQRPPASVRGGDPPAFRLEVVLAAALACCLCGLEFNFWQAATAGSLAELLDLLLLVAATWMLLEHRGNREELRWVFAAAFVWGLGAAQSWVMLVGLPWFVAALVGLRRLEFFRPGFLALTAGAGLAGLFFYALPPLANWLTPGATQDFGEAWQAAFATTRSTLATLFHQLVRGGPWVAMLGIFYLLVPVAPLFIGRQERGYAWMIHLLLALLLVVNLWLALDPVSGPRQLIGKQTGLALSLLTFDYLNALGAGYLAGYFILVAQIGPRTFGKRNFSWKLQWWLGRATVPLLAVALAGIGAALLARNAAVIWRAKHLSIAHLGDCSVRALPGDDGGGIVLSDDPVRLLAFRCADTSGRWLAVNPGALARPRHRERLEQLRPLGWFAQSGARELNPAEVATLLQHLAPTNRLYYLEPGCGSLFESFDLQPRGAIYELQPRTPTRMASPQLTAAEIEQGEKAWDELWQTSAEPLSRQIQSAAHPGGKWLRLLALTTAPARELPLLGEQFSLALNDWGARLQRHGRLPEARRRLEQALVLNSNNFAAAFNLQCNSNLQARVRMDLGDPAATARQIGDARRLFQLRQQNGTFDSPQLCYLLASAYREAGFPHQAAGLLERTLEFVPDSTLAASALLEVYADTGRHDEALAWVARLRNASLGTPQAEPMAIEMSLFEARLWYARTNALRATAILHALAKRAPNDDALAARIGRSFLAAGDLTNGLAFNAERLDVMPDSTALLLNHSGFLLLLGYPQEAIPILNRALALTNSAAARLNRAQAYLQTGDLAAAEADFLQATNASTDPGLAMPVYQIHLGLAGIALQRGNTNLAIQHFETCLSNTPPGSAQSRAAEQWWRSLKPGAALTTAAK